MARIKNQTCVLHRGNRNNNVIVAYVCCRLSVCTLFLLHPVYTNNIGKLYRYLSKIVFTVYQTFAMVMRPSAHSLHLPVVYSANKT